MQSSAYVASQTRSDGDAAPGVDQQSCLAWDVVERLEELERIRPAWNALRAQAPFTPPNADPDRFAVVTAHLGADVAPYVTVLSDGDRPRAMLIGRTSRRRVTHRFGYLSIRSPRLRCLDVVYGGLITDGSRTSQVALVDYVGMLQLKGDFEHIMINHLDAQSPLVKNLRGTTARREPHWQMQLVPGSYEETMQSHSSKHRKKLRRYERILREAFNGKVSLQVFTEEAHIADFMDVLATIAPHTYQFQLGLAQSQFDLTSSLLRLEAAQGRMRSYALIADGKPLAFQNGAVYGGCYYCDGRGYLPQHHDLRPGSTLSQLIIQDLCEQQLHTIDYGFGDADYKRIYGTQSWDEVTLHLYGRGIRATYAAQLERCARWTSQTAKSVLGRVGGVAGVKRFWRKRLGRRPADD